MALDFRYYEEKAPLKFMFQPYRLTKRFLIRTYACRVNCEHRHKLAGPCNILLSLGNVDTIKKHIHFYWHWLYESHFKLHLHLGNSYSELQHEIFGANLLKSQAL